MVIKLEDLEVLFVFNFFFILNCLQQRRKPQPLPSVSVTGSATEKLLRYINCRNADWKSIQLNRFVVRPVFAAFHFVSAGLVRAVSFIFVLHEMSQTWVKT